MNRRAIGCRTMVRALLVACVFIFGAAPAWADDASLIALGERLYKQGIAVSGKPIRVFDRSGQPISGPQSDCVSCHRASGYGSNEGSVYVPPITGPILFAPKTPDRARLLPGMFQQVQPPEFTSQLNAAHRRPAYDKASLARVLREGVDSTGAPIASAMPRYGVSDRDVAALAAWLKALSAHPDPGVDATSVRFAVIVTDQTPADIRKAVIETSQAFVGQVNKGTSAELSRPNFSPFYRSELTSFWRNWELSVWELRGPAAGWPKQLADYYAAAPVFAVASAAVPGPWQAVGRFCDEKRLPCLFPLTDIPAPEASSPGYTLYLSGGLPLEARSMAAYLRARPSLKRVVQLADTGPRGAAPAAALLGEWGSDASSMPLSTISVSGNEAWDDAVKRAAALAGADGALVVWPGDDPTFALAALREHRPPVAMIVLASAAEAGAKAMLSGDVADRVRIMHPTELPTGYQPQSFRIRQWLDARRVALDPPEPQLNVYYSLSVLEKAMMEIQGDFSRDYLIEHIETVAESNLNPGVYPNLSLGPGQRIASRGCYVVRLDKSAPHGIRVDGEWIVP